MKQKQKGFIPIAIMVAAFALLVLGGGTVYYFGRANKLTKEVRTEIGVSTEEPVATQAQTTADEFADWQEYLNEKYHYKVKYPKEWYFIKEGYSPPPPTSIRLSSINASYPSAGTRYMSVEISVDPALGRTLADYEEIASLKSQYYQETKLTIGGEPAVKIAVPDPNSAEPISVYIQHKNYIYRVVWGDSTDEFVQNRSLLEKILNTFAFTD